MDIDFVPPFMFIATEKGLQIEVPEDPEPSTPKERIMAQIGMTEVDTQPTNYSIGTAGICWLVCTGLVILLLDAGLIKQHCSLLKRNLGYARRTMDTGKATE